MGLFSVAADVPTPERLFPGLENIIRSALEQSPRMLNRALDLEIAENDRISARAGLLPNVSGYYRQYETQDDRADLPDKLTVSKAYYDVSVSQPLFHWGERQNYYRMAEIRQKMSKGNYRDGYRLLAHELRLQYLSLIIKKSYLGRARFNLEFNRSQLKVAEERLAKKVISEPEIFSVRLGVERAEIEAERAEFDLLNAKRAFARVSGSAILDDAQLPDAIPALTYSAGEYQRLLAGYLSQNDPPTLEAVNLRHNLALEDLNLRNQKTRLRPKLSLVAGMSQDEQSYTTNLTQKFRVNSLYGGLNLSWNLFDGFATGAAVRNSLARIRQMENDYRDLTQRLDEQAQSQVKFLNFSARNMSITDRFVASAEGQLKARQDDFARGVSSETDVSAAQLGLFDAKLNAFNARVDFLAKTVEFLGTIVEDPALSYLPAKP